MRTEEANDSCLSLSLRSHQPCVLSGLKLKSREASIKTWLALLLIQPKHFFNGYVVWM